MDITWLSTLLLALICSCLIYSSWNLMQRKNNLPPGPTPLPIVGNVLQMRRGEMVKSLLEFGKKYGSIYTVYFGNNPVVVLCGYEVVKEALIDRADEFDTRGKLPTVDPFIRRNGVVFSSGKQWKDLRRFTLTTLRNFGMGKKTIEQRIQEESGFLVAEIRSHKEKSIDPSSILVKSVSNIICSIVFGDRFEYNNESFQRLLALFAANFRDISSPWGQLQHMLPNIMYYVPGPHKRINTPLTDLTNFILERVKLNQETFDPNSPRDYIDCFLIKQQQEKDNSSFNEENMIMTIMNLFLAGTETVSTTLRYGFLTLMRYPEIQARLHKEIDSVIGENRTPCLVDQNKMPYMDAVIHEIQRFGDILPINLPHATSNDVNFRGYTIPKGTDVYPLLCTVLRDPKQFPSPNKFNPNNFLDSNGCFKKNDAFMPFSAGKRMCLGEGLACMELFIFLTTILQNFTLTSKTKLTDDDIAPRTIGLVSAPIFYEMSFIPRAE